MEELRSQTKESKATQEHINSRKYLPILGQKDKGGYPCSWIQGLGPHGSNWDQGKRDGPARAE